MTDMNITMTEPDDVSDVVRMIAERMGTHPADFVDSEDSTISKGYYTGRTPKFSYIYQSLTRTLKHGEDFPYPFMTEAEQQLLRTAALKLYRFTFEANILTRLYAPEGQQLQAAITRRELEAQWLVYAQQVNASSNTYGNSYDQLRNVAWNSEEAK